MTLPANNATAPPEPESLSVKTNLNGTLGFEISRPIGQPYNTRFQIIRSTNSADASVGTVVYDGTDLRVNLVMPASHHWYYARAYVNPNSPTAYTPNTFGVLGLPLGFTTAQLGDNAATDTMTLTAAPVEGLTPSAEGTTYYDLNQYRDTPTGPILQSAGATTVLTGVIPFDCVAIITATFKCGSGVGNCIVRPYLEDLGTGEINTGSTGNEYTLTTDLELVTMQQMFNLVAGHSYRIGVRKINTTPTLLETFNQVQTQIEFIKK